MTIELPPELEQYIADKVAGGSYATGSEVVRDALRLLQEQELEEPNEEELRRLLDVGLADIAAGRVVPLTRELIENIKTEGRKRMAEKQRHA